MDTKTIPAITIKADGDQGIVEHIIAVMGNVDQGGDRIHPGAFTKTITERGGKVRVIDNHNYSSVLNVIGRPVELMEIGRSDLPPQLLDKFPEATGALKATTQFLMDTPEGSGAFKRIKTGAIDEYSFGYDTLDSDYETIGDDEDKATIRNLRTLKLYEYGPVIWGMNEATTTVSAKTNEEQDEQEPPADEGIDIDAAIDAFEKTMAIAGLKVNINLDDGIADGIIDVDISPQDLDEEQDNGDQAPDLDEDGAELNDEQEQDDGAGPDDEPPTSDDDLMQIIDIELEQIDLLEV